MSSSCSSSSSSTTSPSGRYVTQGSLDGFHLLLVKVVVVIETSNEDGSSGLFMLVADDLVIGCLVVLRLSHTGFAVFEVLSYIVRFGVELHVVVLHRVVKMT